VGYRLVSWKLVITGPARKELERLPTDVRARILRGLTDAALCEIEHGSVKRMQGPGARYRLRVGDYRVIFEVGAGELIVKSVGHRREVYR